MTSSTNTSALFNTDSIVDLRKEKDYSSMGLEEILAEIREEEKPAPVGETVTMNQVNQLLDTMERINKGFKCVNDKNEELSSLYVKGNNAAEDRRVLIEKWNEFIKSSRFLGLYGSQKSILWNRYKAALAEKTSALNEIDSVLKAERVILNKYWKVLNELRAWVKSVPSAVWAAYYQIVNSDNNNKWSTSTGDMQESLDQMVAFTKSDYNIFFDMMDTHEIEEARIREEDVRSHKLEAAFTEATSIARELGI